MVGILLDVEEAEEVVLAENTVDEGEDGDVEAEDGDEPATQYFIMLTRCQPGMPDWRGRLCKMPVQWNGP